MSVFYGTIRAVKTATGSLDAVLLQLREFGVLPKTDARLPSAVAILAVEPVAGSWWSHPRAHEIFRALESLADHQSRVRIRWCIGEFRPSFFRSRWAERVGLDSRPISPKHSKRTLERMLSELNQAHGGRGRLPWTTRS